MAFWAMHTILYAFLQTFAADIVLHASAFGFNFLTADYETSAALLALNLGTICAMVI